jgi:DNA-directed RNA polymerase specialized sigma24 family protein
MSPAALRLYRAERMLERDFHALRARVLAIVRGRLRARGATLDAADLDACYATAWQGLYGAAVRGEEVANPAAWLALVTYRRAIEELRLRRRSESELDATAGVESDVDAVLDDRARLRQLLEGMRCRLDLREREAAALCYLHGYSRAEAARRMGISETRMRKLMEGRGAGRAGVSQKIGSLVQTISAGEFCREQESLMRALAFGMLDPAGERHRIALAHLRGCPACRRQVASLRGIAVVLPPVLTLPGAGRAGIAALAAGTHGAAAPAPLSASAAAGSGVAGGGWALGGGGLAAKLAAGCLLALGVGAGCVTLARSGHDRGHSAPLARRSTAALPPRVGRAGAPPASPRAPVRRRSLSGQPAAAAAARRREFTPEQAPAPEPAQRAARAALAHPGGSAPPGAAEREFGPG